MANNVPITEGTGASSIAAEQIGTTKYQQIKLVGGETGSTSVLGITPDNAAKVSVIGTVTVGTHSVSGTVQAQLVSTNASIITVGTAAANQSVSGTVNVTQGTTPWAVAGSVAAFQAGTQITSIAGQVTVVSSLAGGIFPVSGSVAAVVTNFPTTQNVSGSVVATQGTTPWNIAGSVAATVTNTVTVVSSISGGIFPISGSVAATVTNTNLNVGGSVVAFQGGTWTQGLTSSNASVITVGQGSIAVNIIAGSIAASFTPPANQSVSGTVQTQILSTNASVITVAQSSVAVAIVSGSIAATFTPPANQSVSGTVQTDVRGSVATVIIGGSVAVATGNSSVQVLNFPANQSVSGTVTANQGTTPWIDNISGSVATVIIGGSIATATTNSSVMLLNGANTIGSVTTLQGTNPWVTLVTGSVLIAQGQDVSPAIASILVGVTANTNGSVLTTSGWQVANVQITSGPGASITAALNFEGTVDGTQFYPIQGYNLSTNAISSVTTTEGSWAFNVTGLQGMRTRVSNWSVGSITARAALSPMDARTFAVANHSVSGTVNLGIGATMIGSVVAYQGAIPWTMGSVYGNISGSVAAFVVGNSSVITVQQANSIAGTYAEDAAHTTGNRGIFVMGVRNDTMASVTSADVEYAQLTVGVAGETITANGATLTKWVQGTADFRQGNAGASILIIANGTASIFQYITGVQIANMGPSSVLVTLAAGGSTLGYSIAPAGGGSNIYYANGLKTPGSFGLAASISGIASVLVSAQGFISKI